MSLRSHLATAALGGLVATAVVAEATPAAEARRFAALDSFAQALATVAAEYVAPVDDVTLLRGAMRGMLADLDPHSTYLAPEAYRQLRQDTDGEFGGIGVVFELGDVLPGELPAPRELARAEPVVEDVVPGSPADLAGVRAGDRVVAVDRQLTVAPGRAVDDLDRWEALLRGASGTRVTLTVRRAGWPEPRDLSLVRAQVKVPSVEAAAVARGIGYLAIARFQEATTADVAAALTRLQDTGDLRGLVLDLRGDPGGLVDAGIAVADHFLAEGTIVTMRSRGGAVERHVAHAAGTFPRMAMACLIDEGTASAAEILVGALADHQRCTVVGVTSYGKGSVQTFFDLDDGGGLKLTTSQYVTPSGKSLEGLGITPHLEVEAFAGDVIVAAGGDRADPGPTPADPDAPGEVPTGDARIKARLKDDPQFEAALDVVRRALASRAP